MYFFFVNKTRKMYIQSKSSFIQVYSHYLVLFTYWYQTHFMQGFLKKNKMKQPRYINSKFCCIDDALLLDSFMLQNSGNARKWSAYFKVKTACGSHHDFQDRGLLLTWKLLNQRFLVVKLKSSHFKIYMVAIMSYRSFIYLFPLGIQLSRGKGWNLLNRFNPAPCVSACHKL